MEEDESHDCHLKLVIFQLQILNIHQRQRTRMLVPGQTEHPFRVVDSEDDRGW